VPKELLGHLNALNWRLIHLLELARRPSEAPRPPELQMESILTRNARRQTAV